MAFAVVARACLLPGANSPEQLHRRLVAGHDLLGEARPGSWGVPDELVLTDDPKRSADRTWSRRGGYVDGFRGLDPAGLDLGDVDPRRLDPLFGWVMHTAREALRGARAVDRRRAGVFLGNLSFPTRGMSRFVESVWLDGAPDAVRDQLGLDDAQAMDRFMSGLPALMTARALGLGGPAVALDAACASALYAIHAACRRLEDGDVDVMLAGAVSRSDDLFIHVGFSALQALSKTGRSRPFHPDADGLVPAEGCVIVALKRLADAERDGDTIHGVIRAVGLSNDGRAGGILAPDAGGQERAMRAAYAEAGWEPGEVGLVECHATGTPVGDKVEITSMARLYEGQRGVAIGSIKGNMGHPITAAGGAALLKVLGAMAEGVRPPSLHAPEHVPALDGTPFRLVRRAEAWDGPRKAAVSAFGFGGNNAHLLIEPYRTGLTARRAPPRRRVGVVAMAARAASLPDTAAFEAAALAGVDARGPDGHGRAAEVRLPMTGLRFPPNDLKATLPQQALILAAALDAVAASGPLPRERTGVLVGMGADPEVCRYGARWRLAGWAATGGWTEAKLAAARDAVVPVLTSAGVVGTMPNIPANRIQTQLDLAGPGFTVSAEQRSGTEALRLAARAVARGDLDAAVVGAVDVACEPAHLAAKRALGDDGAPGDAAVVLVLRPVDAAVAAGQPVLAELEELGFGDEGGVRAYVGGATLDLAAQLGDSHAASGLVTVAAAVAAVRHAAVPGPGGATPALGVLGAKVVVGAAPVGSERWAVLPVHLTPHLEGPAPLLARFAAADTPSLLARLRAASPGGEGPCRLVVAAADPATLGARAAAAGAAIQGGAVGHVAPGCFFAVGPRSGPVVAVASAVPAGPEAARTLLLAFPGLVASGVADAARRGPGAGEARQAVAVAAQGAWLAAVAGVRVGATGGIAALAAHPSRLDAWLEQPERDGGGASAGVRVRFGAAGDVDADVVMQPPGADALEAALVGAGALWALGQDVDLAAVDRCLPRTKHEGGPMLTLPAHAPAVVPPEGGGRRRADTVGGAMGSGWMQTSPRANERVDGASLLGGGEAPRIVRAEGEVVAPAAPAALGAPPSTLAALAAMQADIAAAHERFVVASAEAHRAFLGLRERAMGVAPALATPAIPARAATAPRPLPTAAAVAPAPAAAAAPAPRPLPNVAAVTPTASARPTPPPAPTVRADGAEVLPQPPALPSITGAPARRVGASPAPAAPVPAAAPATAPPATASAPKAAAGGLVDTLALARQPVASLPGLKLDREGLKVHAAGPISTIFGPQFARQDGYHRQVRMPEPPLLLADRVVGLDAEPGVLGKGVVWTETDVTEDAWYLHQGRIPAGVMIEAGQADLLLISWMGIDFLNQSDRVYRLLGCTLTYHDRLPKVGDTLRYAIAVDGHAQHGDVRLFFFHYDAVVDDRPVLSVRGGQAGFFTDAELAESAGVLWEAETGEHDASARVDAPAVVCTRDAFSRAQVEAFGQGDAFGCFGPGFEMTQTHNDTPRIQGPPMLFFHEVDRFDPKGGPWGKGYLKATWQVKPDDWFFEGHFHNDPCMPGTLMFEGCLQALAFYLAGLGYTLRRDGWRFEPVTGEPIAMRCRGQVLPSASVLTYEVFVEEVHEGPEPTVYADLLCTVDGLKAFHARRCGLRLTPSWPMDHWGRKLLAGHVDPEPVAVVDGFRFDYKAMLACAWGRPSEAFGPMYARFDGPRTVPRLPGPPYHFLTRATSVEGPIGGMKQGSKVQVAYDVPPDAWYFDDNGAETMPFCVLLEAALQPCGWLASYIGSALTAEEDLFFRNLDGTGTLTREVTRGSGTMLTDVTLTQLSRSAGMIIVGFDVTCSMGGEPFYLMKTVFGFFPADALANQKGLPILPDHRADYDREGGVAVDLSGSPSPWCDGTLRLPTPKLRMIDRFRYWPGEGKAGLGRLRSEKDVRPEEWMFKAHFFQDPVQPGSLGIEAMIQLLQAYMIEQGMGAGMAAPRFEPLALDEAMTWKYRGQVTPQKKLVVVTLEITGQGTDERGAWAKGDASLWCDGLRIYQATNLGMRVVDGPPPHTPPSGDDSEGDTAPGDWRVIDPAVDEWVADHQPTWTVPALPMTVLVDRMVRAGLEGRPGRSLSRVERAEAQRWVRVTGPVALDADLVDLDAERTEVRLRADGEQVALAVLRWGAPLPAHEPYKAIAGEPVADVYGDGSLFHGPAFQLVTALTRGPQGATAMLDAGRDGVDRGVVRPGVLDAALHAIPHDDLPQWFPQLSAGMAAYPAQIRDLVLHAPIPTSGPLRVEVRPQGLHGRWPVCVVQVIAGERVVVSFRLWEVLLPKGPIGEAPPRDRLAFLRDRRFVPGLALSKVGPTTVLDGSAVRGSDWLPGTVAAVYGATGADLVAEVAVRDHVAARLGVHPSGLCVDGGVVTAPTHPLVRVDVDVSGPVNRRQVRGEPRLELGAVEAFWRRWFGLSGWPVEDLYYALVERFVADVVVPDPAALAAVHGRPSLFLANHQTGIESLLFSIVGSALTGVPTATLAKSEHRESWLGRLIQHGFTWPGAKDPGVITFFDRQDQASLGAIIRSLGQGMADAGRSTMVHVEGTRALSCAEPVRTMSATFVDMAVQVGAPVIPVRFEGGLPRAPLTQRLDFPVGMGRQRFWIGAPLLPEQLAALPYKDRRQAVLDAINTLGVGPEAEVPLDPDPELAAAVAAWSASRGVDEAHATLWEVLRRSSRRSAGTEALVAFVERGVAPGDGAEGRWVRGMGRGLGGRA